MQSSFGRKTTKSNENDSSETDRSGPELSTIARIMLPLCGCCSGQKRSDSSQCKIEQMASTQWNLSGTDKKTALFQKRRTIHF